MRPASTLLLLSLTTLPVATQETEPQSAPRLILETLSGERRSLDFAGLDLRDPRERGAWTLRVEGFQPLRSRKKGTLAQVRLHSGEELRGRIAGGEGEVLSIELLGGVLLPIEVDRIERVLLPEHLSGEGLGPLQAPPEGDRLYRRTQAALDAVDGTLDSFSKDGVSFESTEVGLKDFPWDGIAALFIEYLGDEEPRSTPKVPVVVDLTDQSRVRGALERMTPNSCEVIVGGHALELPWNAIAEVTVVDGRIQFLSDLKPTTEEGFGVPFDDDLGMSWPHRMDANAFDGGPLRSGGSTWRRGIGMHAPSKLSFRLDRDYKELVGYCAIDDSSLRNPKRARGAAIFRLHLDGEQVWESELIRGGDDPVALPRLALTGKKSLVLEVDPAGIHAGDRANWLRMVLVR